MEITKPSELDVILRKSEAHAMTCTIDRGTTSCIYRRQIEHGFLTLSVSSKMVKKAMQVFELFLKRMFKEGFSLILDCHSHYHCPASAIVVNGETIPVRVKEKQTYEVYFENRMTYRRAVPSGILAVEVYCGTSWTSSKVLMESNGNTWDKLFDDLVPQLLKYADRIKAARIESEEWNRKLEEKEQARKAQEKIITDRAKAAKSIIEDILLFERAEMMRRYCDIAEQLTDSDEYREKIAIARSVADWIDPTKDYEDEILSEMFDADDFV